jgi:hypothetical protein
MREVEQRLAEFRDVFGSGRTVFEPWDGPTARSDPLAVLVFCGDDFTLKASEFAAVQRAQPQAIVATSSSGFSRIATGGAGCAVGSACRIDTSDGVSSPSVAAAGAGGSEGCGRAPRCPMRYKIAATTVRPSKRIYGHHGCGFPLVTATTKYPPGWPATLQRGHRNGAQISQHVLSVGCLVPARGTLDRLERRSCAQPGYEYLVRQ